LTALTQLADVSLGSIAAYSVHPQNHMGLSMGIPEKGLGHQVTIYGNLLSLLSPFKKM
jgi:hypothetical protein